MVTTKYTHAVDVAVVGIGHLSGQCRDARFFPRSPGFVKYFFPQRKKLHCGHNGSRRRGGSGGGEVLVSVQFKLVIGIRRLVGMVGWRHQLPKRDGWMTGPADLVIVDDDDEHDDATGPW